MGVSPGTVRQWVIHEKPPVSSSRRFGRQIRSHGLGAQDPGATVRLPASESPLKQRSQGACSIKPIFSYYACDVITDSRMTTTSGSHGFPESGVWPCAYSYQRTCRSFATTGFRRVRHRWCLCCALADLSTRIYEWFDEFGRNVMRTEHMNRRSFMRLGVGGTGALLFGMYGCMNPAGQSGGSRAGSPRGRRSTKVTCWSVMSSITR
jgi:hypothetical protein